MTLRRPVETIWVGLSFVRLGKQQKGQFPRQQRCGAELELRRNRTRNNRVKSSLTHRLLTLSRLDDVRLHRRWCRRNVNETELNTPRPRCAFDGIRSGRD